MVIRGGKLSARGGKCVRASCLCFSRYWSGEITSEGWRHLGGVVLSRFAFDVAWGLVQAQEMARQREQERILKRPEQKKITLSLKKSGGLF